MREHRGLLMAAVVLAILLAASDWSISSIQTQPSQEQPRLQKEVLSRVPHAPIVITSDQDFIDQAWPGDGTSTSPYLLQGLEIDQTLNESCVWIDNTTAWFRVECCTFTHPDYGDPMVTLTNVSNGEARNCTFFGASAAVYVEDSNNVALENLNCNASMVFIVDSWQVSVTRCTINYAASNGITMIRSDMITIENNTVGYCMSGIWLDTSVLSDIINNTLMENIMFQLSLDEDSRENTISGNRFYQGQMYTVLDEGSDNQWDGNWWSDYSGTGVYIIPGGAGSVDHAPTGPATVTTTTTQQKPVTTLPLGFFLPMDPVHRGILAAEIVIMMSTIGIVALVVFLRQKRAQPKAELAV